MPRSTLFLWIAMAILTSGCGPKLFIHTTQAIPALPDTARYVILGENDSTKIGGEKIGQASYVETVYTSPWRERRIVEFFRSAALSNGANLVKVTYDQHSGHHSLGRVDVLFYKVPDLQTYETRIEWSVDRRLTVADFKAEAVMGSRSHCDFYLNADFGKGDIKGRFSTRAIFYTSNSWIDPKAANRAELLTHEQGNFDLCEIYRRQLEKALGESHRIHYLNWRREGERIYKQIYAAYLATRAQYDSETDHGLDYAKQAIWTKKIADSVIGDIRILSSGQLDEKAKELTPPVDRALVYVIRPNRYNTAFWKRMIVDPYCLLLGQYFLFINPYRFVVNYSSGQSMDQIKRRQYMYRLVDPGNCLFTPGLSGQDIPGKELLLSLEGGKVYYIKMNIVEKRFFAGARAELLVLDEKEGRRWLEKCRLSARYEDFVLPVFPDPLR